MSFGAACRDDGTVRFRLWAPAARTVELRLGAAEDGPVLPMGSCGDGWFETVTDRAGPGSLYRYRIDDAVEVPDPASRFQPQDVHGPSQVIDPAAWQWRDGGWQGLPWQETVLYELHVGTFTPAGTLAAVESRLDHLRDMGVTAVELMPLADFPGRRNWGYDGVLPFAPDHVYGTPDDLRHLVESAHGRGLSVFVDVVYNHFGPEGNYLHRYAPDFFTDRYQTPWGAAINFDGPGSRWVRRFFIENALYWLTEYHIDGLRLDAVHAIRDSTRPDILEELADRVASRFAGDRPVHLVLENDANQARYLEGTTKNRPGRYRAQWNDDWHHGAHVLATGEAAGYYVDYADRPLFHLGRCLTEGFAYQGEVSAYRDGERRGEPSRGLAPTAFVNFLQNHDQVGNRAFGERLASLADPAAIRALTAVLLLAPSPPLLFMGQEWGAREPFLFFCDFGPELAGLVTAGRRREFARFPQFAEPASRELIPDPASAETFSRSRLDWSARESEEGRHWLALHRRLLAIRRQEVAPRLCRLGAGRATFELPGGTLLTARWPLDDGGVFSLVANLGPQPAPAAAPPAAGRLLFRSDQPEGPETDAAGLPAWTVRWYLAEHTDAPGGAP